MEFLYHNDTSLEKCSEKANETFFKVVPNFQSIYRKYHLNSYPLGKRLYVTSLLKLFFPIFLFVLLFYS